MVSAAGRCEEHWPAMGGRAATGPESLFVFFTFSMWTVLFPFVVSSFSTNCIQTMRQLVSRGKMGMHRFINETATINISCMRKCAKYVDKADSREQHEVGTDSAIERTPHTCSSDCSLNDILQAS